MSLPVRVQFIDGEFIETPVTNEELAEINDRYDKSARIESAAMMSEYLAGVRTMRMQLLNVMAGIATAAVIDGDTVIPNAFKVARQALLNLPQLDEVKNAKTKEELESVVKAEYARIVEATPAALRSAFKEIQP